MLRQTRLSSIFLLNRPGIIQGLILLLQLSLCPEVLAADDNGAYPGTTVLAHNRDYTFGFYPYGWRGTDPRGNRIFAVQTNAYGLWVNASKARVERLGAFPQGVSEEEAVGQGNEVLLGLPETSLTFSVSIQGETYEAVSAVPALDRLLIKRTGRYVQHFELLDVALKKEDGTTLPDVNAKLVFYCWPDRFSVTLSLTPVQVALNEVRFSMSLYAAESFLRLWLWKDGGFVEGVPRGSSSYGLVALTEPGDSGIALINPTPQSQKLRVVSSQRVVCESLSAAAVSKASEITFSIVATASKQELSHWVDREIEAMLSPLAAADITASATGPVTGIQPVHYDPVTGEYRILTPSKNNHYSQVERILLHLANPSAIPRTLRLHFYKDSTLGGGFSITGMSPLLRDLNGLPIALPVQISKNWHVNPSWFSGLTMLSLDPDQQVDLEYDLTYAYWGKRDMENPLPAVSHAHLCLEGYGGNQQWDQLAIGSFGESICYDPDVNLKRAMGDDIRPLMVRSMDAKSPQWTWTNNVGGLDFLVYYKNNQKQFLSRQKTLFSRYCPVLTDVTYAGETPDGAVQSRIRTQTWRTDDYVRGLYTIRYDVVAPVDNLTRLAFFQMGADGYNTNPFDKFARGSLAGLEETWDASTTRGGWTYHRRGIELTGEQPWFAMYEYGVPEKNAGAWANRGVIIRSWKARLGGVECPHPFYSVYGTVDGNVPSALVELSPPEGLTRLTAGDFVEAVVEMMVVPQFAADYYGPNQNLSALLNAHPDSWEPVLREAQSNNLIVTAFGGSVERTLPVEIRTENGIQVRFSITGGVGFVPVTIRGVRRQGPFQLKHKLKDYRWERIDQSSSLGNDWWQTGPGNKAGEADITFTVQLENPDGQISTHEFEWSLWDDPTEDRKRKPASG